ncbi:VCBS repeat-containing protein [uncultured Lacinutrix sp.]|uniref:VCBS repeat-containing protein n=1 Tax=uncultured Lacinutrix sp. TaxID=574032 RepID=UPI00262043E2|nr:VCBS repeat-containing protein [uncultured Lacinutrix sp.]
MKKEYLILFLLLFFIISCKNDNTHTEKENVFSMLSPEASGIVFKNVLKETDSVNYFTFTSIYMGGGISVGDINNDGLKDLFFTGNQVQNKLYINKGNLKFEDITDKANIGGTNKWYTGSTMADVNGDGYLDIYCSVSGVSGDKSNELYINNGDNTFIESAKKYGIADKANSVQSTFFDYDSDGDLDLYVANYPKAHVSTPNNVYKQRMLNVKEVESDKLFRNDGNTFTDVSKEAGVQSYGLSLGVTVGDVNNDGAPDLYISNDYSVPDYFYINKGDGTFKEVVKEATNHTAFYGMGIDIADINNDGNLDLFQVDMDAKSNRRQKANMASMNPRLFYEMLLYGFHHQYMHNCFQLNNGIDNNGIPQFSNISRLTGTSSTDWSWGPILADFDNDGYKDLYITNGSRREVTNKDFFAFLNKPENDKLSKLEKSVMIPSEKLDNFAYRNNGNLEFEPANDLWNIKYEGFSTGVTYADLDNDGDLEIITNNIDDYASVFENHSADKNNFITIEFKGKQNNTFGLGVRVYVKTKAQTQMQELTLSRGFQSSIAPELHFGLKNNQIIDELKVVWPDGETQILETVKVNQRLLLNYSDASNESVAMEELTNPIFNTVASFTPDFKHIENGYDDFSKQLLLPHKLSNFGPAIAVGDVNGDGLDDYFMGGAVDYVGRLMLQTKTGFVESKQEVFIKDKIQEDVNAMFFDVDLDGDQDLYVVTGGNAFGPNTELYQDRLYINNGKGTFSKSEALPKMYISGSRVYQIDFNQDGKPDLLVLGRHLPDLYPQPTTSFLLENVSTDLEVEFIDVTKKMAPDLENIGMSTSAVVTDFNKDGKEDFIIVGEWMPIKVFENSGTEFKDVSETVNLGQETTGWWWSIKEGDFDNDGDIDFIVGNNGLNYKYKASEDETFDIYSKDFDNNKKSDIVLSYYNEGKQYPVRGRQCSSEQIPGVKNKFKDYDSFSEATLIDVYTKKSLDNALHYQVKSFASIYLENKEGTFISHELPIEAQFSNINQIVVDDYDNDGNLDAVIAGNLYASEVETPRNDASVGLFLKGNGKGQFDAVPTAKSGLFIKGDTKDMKTIKIGNDNYFVVAKNNDYLQFIKIE